MKTINEIKPDWAAMTDAQIRYQVAAFDRHDDPLPPELIADLERRHARTDGFHYVSGDWRDKVEMMLGA